MQDKESVESFPHISDNQLQILVNENGLSAVQAAVSEVTLKLIDQIAYDSQKTIPFPEKLNFANYSASLSFSFLDLPEVSWNSFLEQPTKHPDKEKLFANPVIANSVYGKVSDLIIAETKFKCLGLLDDYAAFAEILDKTSGFLYDVTETQKPFELKILSFLPAISKDIKELLEGNKFNFFTSHLLECLGKVFLKKLVDFINKAKNMGKFPALPNMLILSGIDEFVAGFASQVGGRRMGIDELTHYLDGLSDLTAAVAGFFWGGPQGAKAGESLAGLTRSLFRLVTMPIFQEFANHPVRAAMVKNWRTLQERRILDGQAAIRFSEMFTLADLEKVGFSQNKIQELDHWADLANTRTHFTVNNEELKQIRINRKRSPELPPPDDDPKKKFFPPPPPPPPPIVVGSSVEDEDKNHNNDHNDPPPPPPRFIVVVDSSAKDEVKNDKNDPPHGGGGMVSGLSHRLNFIEKPPGGVSTTEMARAFIDRGNWPVITFFGLCYKSDALNNEIENGK